MAGTHATRFREGLRGMPWLAAVVMLAPVLAGLLGTILPAFDFLPALGGRTPGLQSWRSLLALPALWSSVRMSLVTGLVTTFASLALVAGFCASWHGHRIFALAQRCLAPWLAVPHVTVALGCAFVLAPSGWVLRWLSPWLTGFNQPPDWLIVHDPHGLSLMFGLIAKEVPFLLVMTLAALGQVDAGRLHGVARTMGYRPVTGWLKVVFPRVYPQIRLPVFAVLAFGMSVVDVSLVLGPTTPAPLAVRLVRSFNDPDLSQRFMASAGALLQVGLVLAAICAWAAGEAVVRWAGARWIFSGRRGTHASATRWTSSLAMLALLLVAGAGVLATMLWSVATAWRFPAALPAGYTMATWIRSLPELADPFMNTVGVALGATLLALLLCVGVLEHEAHGGRRTLAAVDGVVYLPLILPQVAFLFGAQLLLVWANLDGSRFALVWIHLVFVYPYVYLSLAEPYRAWDPRYCRIALCLGASPLRVFLKVKLPMLLRPLATAGAVGFSVSVGQYLPTLFAGSGRYATLTTEAVALSAGGDHRQTAVCALLQVALPLVAFTVATGLPAWWHRHRRGMGVAA